MILLVVLGAWLSVFLCEMWIDNVALYYLTSSLVYSAVSICAFIVWVKFHSRVVFGYIVVNFIAAIFNVLISTPTGYDVYSVFYFADFQKVMAAVELLALVHGGVDALLFFRCRSLSVSGRGLVRDTSLGRDGAR